MIQTQKYHWNHLWEISDFLVWPKSKNKVASRAYSFTAFFQRVTAMLCFKYFGISCVIHLYAQPAVLMCVMSLFILSTAFAFVIVKLPKQLQPPSKDPKAAAQPHIHTLCHFATHTFTHFYFSESASFQSSCVPGMNNGMMGRVLFGGLVGKWNPRQGDL